MIRIRFTLFFDNWLFFDCMIFTNYRQNVYLYFNSYSMKSEKIKFNISKLWIKQDFMNLNKIKLV